MKRMLLAALDVVGKVWALPYTALGLIYGLLWYLPSKLSGAQPQILFGHNAIQFIGSRGVLNRTALTLGNVILYGVDAQPECGGACGDSKAILGKHEQAHTHQYQVLGILFIPVYFLMGGYKGSNRNPLERSAQQFATGEGSWWPLCLGGS